MAQGTVKTNQYFGSSFSISLPYTAQTDGFLICIITNTNGSTGGYNIIDSSDGLHYRVNGFNGYQERAYFPVSKGATLNQGSSGSVGTPTYYFIPMIVA